MEIINFQTVFSLMCTLHMKRAVTNNVTLLMKFWTRIDISVPLVSFAGIKRGVMLMSVKMGWVSTYSSLKLLKANVFLADCTGRKRGEFPSSLEWLQVTTESLVSAGDLMRWTAHLE